MNIPKTVAKMRFVYHSNMLDVYNVLNQLGIVKDEVAEERNKNHCMKCFDCLERMGYDVNSLFENKEKES